MDEVYEQILDAGTRAVEHYEAGRGAGTPTEAADGGPAPMDEAEPMVIDEAAEAGPMFGPMTQNDSDLHDTHTVRTRALTELNERLYGTLNHKLTGGIL